MKRIVFTNVPIMTAPGLYMMQRASLSYVKREMDKAKAGGVEFLSAIGHTATAEVFSMLTGHDIPVNRISYVAEEGDLNFVLKIDGRLPEGVVLETVEQMNEIGFHFLQVTPKPADLPVLE